MSYASSLRLGLCLLWLFAVGAGIAMVLNYQKVPGSTGVTPDHWPSEAQVALDGSHDTLIMFAHPKCPCTRASVEELNRMLARCHGQVATHLMFFKPEQSADDWAQTGLRQSVTAIPGVMVQDDTNGMMAARFGAETSGYVVLYDPQGHLLFHGGITGSRGHAGDNAGEDTITALVSRERPLVSLNLPREVPVYGCSLSDKTCRSKMAAK